MADLATQLLYAGYRAAGLAVLPLVPLFLSRRARDGKEDAARLAERYGRASHPRPPGRLVWIHAASVGETNAIMPVVDRVAEMGMSVVFTSVTLTSAKIAAGRLPGRAIHQFSPLDIAPYVGRFLDHWRPDLALFVESELWPTTIMKLAQAEIPQILVNARLSERSFRSWRRLGRAAQGLFGRIALGLAQSEPDGARYRTLGVPGVKVTGNLKFDVPPPSAKPEAAAQFRALAGNRPVWVAASTHEGEEAIVAAADRILRETRPDLLTIIVPRHPSRGPSVGAALAAGGHKIALRSAGQPLSSAVEIYVADTLGELGLFFRVAPIAFLGGSLIPHGGQNPIEPLRLNAAVLNGPHVHNFAEVYAALDRVGGFGVIADAESLARVVGKLLDDSVALRRYVDLAAEALLPFTGAFDATMAALKPYLDPLILAPARGLRGEAARP